MLPRSIKSGMTSTAPRKIKKVTVMQYSDLFWCSRGNSPSRALKTVRRTVFARRDADGRHRLFESAPCSIVHNFIQNKKSSIFSDAALGAAGGIRTSGLWSRSPTLYPAELRPHIYENRRWDEIHRIKL